MLRRAILLVALLRTLAKSESEESSNTVTLLRQATVEFAEMDGRISHQSQSSGRPGLPAGAVVNSRGLVGLDKSLGVVVEVPEVLTELNPAEPVRVTEVRVTSTVTEPVVAGVER